MFENTNITLADSSKVDFYEHEVFIILNIMGHPEALVTDESCVADFLQIIPSNLKMYRCSAYEFLEHIKNETLETVEVPALTDFEEESILDNNRVMSELNHLLQKEEPISEYDLIGDLAQQLHFILKQRTLH